MTAVTAVVEVGTATVEVASHPPGRVEILAALAGPPGRDGDMAPGVYDPRAIRADTFDLQHHTGVLDAGVFT
jgi:hypothetical protein